MTSCAASLPVVRAVMGPKYIWVRSTGTAVKIVDSGDTKGDISHVACVTLR